MAPRPTPKFAQVPGRHDSHTRRQDGWAPTAANAVAAAAPATSLFAALGLAGGGYLAGREDVAACGALVGAFGLVAERFASRGLRRRLRRERMRHRDDLRGVSRDLADLQRQFAALRSELDAARSARVEPADLHPPIGVEAGAVRRLAVPEPVPVQVPVQVPVAVPVAGQALHLAEDAPLDEPRDDEPAAAEPVPVSAAPVSAAPVAALGLLIPGQVRSPIATGGIPLLAPGPSEPVRVIDLRATGPATAPIAVPMARPVTAPVTAPLTAPLTRPLTAPLTRPTTLPPAAVDALVYAALAEAEADELTRVLADPGRRGRHAGNLLAGDAHHAGDFARDDAAEPASSVLFVVNRGRHVA